MSRQVKMHKIGEDQILIQFGHVVEKQCVMWRGPWAFDKNLVILQELEVGDDPASVSLNECDFSVHAAGLPVTLMHNAMAELLGSAMGSCLKTDQLADYGCIGEVL